MITQFHSLPWRACFLLLIIFHTSFLTLRAQEWEIGGGIGAMNYKGDLSPAIQPRFARPGGNLFVRYNAGRAVSFKFNLLGGKVFAEDRQSDDPFLIARNRSFDAAIFEFSPQFEYNFLNYRDEKTRQNWTPYVLLGAALFTYSGEDNTRRDFKGTQFAIPFGLGIKYVLGGNWNLGLEFGARKTFTDTLDGLGGPLVNSRLLNGNPDSKDMYIYTGLTISYTFYRVLCPEFY